MVTQAVKESSTWSRQVKTVGLGCYLSEIIWDTWLIQFDIQVTNVTPLISEVKGRSGDSDKKGRRRVDLQQSLQGDQSSRGQIKGWIAWKDARGYADLSKRENIPPEGIPHKAACFTRARHKATAGNRRALMTLAAEAPLSLSLKRNSFRHMTQNQPQMTHALVWGAVKVAERLEVRGWC